MVWYQRSREEWIQSATVTQFYHASTNVHKAKNRRISLTRTDGNTIADEEEMKTMVQEYFVNMFTVEREDNDVIFLKGRFPKLSKAKWRKINDPFTRDEVKDALFSMAPYKAAGPDGYHTGFYQKVWYTVGDSLYSQTLEYLESGIMKKGLNDT